MLRFFLGQNNLSIEVSLTAQEYKWVSASCWGNLKKCWGLGNIRWTYFPSKSSCSILGHSMPRTLGRAPVTLLLSPSGWPFSRVCLTFCFGSSQCGNMAREGLRTLVVAKKVLTEEQYQDFEVCTYICLYATNYPERCFLVCLRFVFYFLEVFLMVSKLQPYSLKL